jgi:hypothetical protein
VSAAAFLPAGSSADTAFAHNTNINAQHSLSVMAVIPQEGSENFLPGSIPFL